MGCPKGLSILDVYFLQQHEMPLEVHLWTDQATQWSVYFLAIIYRHRPIFPNAKFSIVGAEAFNFSVRNGKRLFHFAQDTDK